MNAIIICKVKPWHDERTKKYHTTPQFPSAVTFLNVLQIFNSVPKLQQMHVFTCVFTCTCADMSMDVFKWEAVPLRMNMCGAVCSQIQTGITAQDGSLIRSSIFYPPSQFVHFKMSPFKRSRIVSGAPWSREFLFNVQAEKDKPGLQAGCAAHRTRRQNVSECDNHFGFTLQI